MRAVRAHHEQELEEQFVGVREIARIRKREMSEAVLTTDLTELAGPIRYDTGKTGIRQMGIGGMAAAVKAPAEGPAAIHAVFRGRVHTERVLGLKKIRDGQSELIAGAPKQLCTEQEGIVDSAAQRLPAECRVSAIQIGQKV